MMTATTLLSDLQARGFRFTAIDKGVFVKPSKLLTDDDREAIRHHKVELLTLLRFETDAGEVCPICGGEVREQRGKHFRHLWCPTPGHFDAWRALGVERLGDSDAPI